MSITASELIVQCLESQGVKFVFGIPGAKIDAVFDALAQSKIKLIICRHEQNAAFMAAAYGRLTGRPGVVLVTSGPGVSNLVTGLLTATTEGDPVVAIGGNVPRSMLLKETHQSAHNVQMLAPVTKSSVQISAIENIPEVFVNAFRTAVEPRAGACFISIPQDILQEKTKLSPICTDKQISYGIAHDKLIAQAADRINHATFPVLLLGQEASHPRNTVQIRALLEKIKLPTVSTYQASGVISRELVHCFAGRVGLFRNQPGDKLLKKADVVISVGLNQVEYDPEVWNPDNDKDIIHIDYNPAKIRYTYHPILELLGDVDINIEHLNQKLDPKIADKNLKHVKPFYDAHQAIINSGKFKEGSLMHPLRFIHELRTFIDDDTLVICDIGTIYMWMARYFLSYEPHHLLFSNGQQTLGVALPWAMGANFACPDKKIISMSGDGGFLFSAMELENAVRQKHHFIHFIWRDNSYNMVKEQELMKYKRASGVDFNAIDIPSFAKAFGAKGYILQNPNDFKSLFKEISLQRVPVLVDVAIDYSDNLSLFEAC